MGWQDAPEVPDWQKSPEVTGKEGAQPSAEMPLKYRAMDIGKGLARSVGLAGRSIIGAFTGPPLMAADAGIGARNLLTGSNYKSASSMWNESLDQLGVLKPQTRSEKVADVLGQMLIGSKLPAPSVDGAPTAALTADPLRTQTLAQSQKAGYVVPPSTTNPTLGNKILESVGGKIATAQDAAAQNADVTNALIKSEFGLHPDVPLGEGTFKALRDEAMPAYEAVKKAGTMSADDLYTKALDAIGAKYQGAAKSFPGLAGAGGKEVSEMVESLKQPTFEADAAVDATKVLRESAGDAYAAGNKTLGKAYRTASNALEDLIERNLSNSGESGNTILSNFRNARQLIAKTYSAEKAFNPATGNISAPKLATQLSKGAPLSGGIKTAAQFGQAFPKAAQAITDSGSVRNTDVILGAGTSALSHEPGWLLYPFARMAARKLLLSNPGQKLAVPASQASDLSPQAMALAQLLGQGASQ